MDSSRFLVYFTNTLLNVSKTIGQCSKTIGQCSGHLEYFIHTLSLCRRSEQQKRRGLCRHGGIRGFLRRIFYKFHPFGIVFVIEHVEMVAADLAPSQSPPKSGEMMHR